jgi:choline dehydrogenase-like flavoprotein
MVRALWYDSDLDTSDAVVVGMGPGGEDVARRLAEAGMSVVGIDAGLLGGECPYWGCVPSRSAPPTCWPRRDGSPAWPDRSTWSPTGSGSSVPDATTM